MYEWAAVYSIVAGHSMRRGTMSHNRMLSRGSTRSETAYFCGWKKSTLWPAYKSLPQLLGRDFVVNFATYTRVYLVPENLYTEDQNDRLVDIDITVEYVKIQLAALTERHVTRS